MLGKDWGYPFYSGANHSSTEGPCQVMSKSRLPNFKPQHGYHVVTGLEQKVLWFPPQTHRVSINFVQFNFRCSIYLCLRLISPWGSMHQNILKLEMQPNFVTCNLLAFVEPCYFVEMLGSESMFLTSDTMYIYITFRIRMQGWCAIIWMYASTGKVTACFLWKSIWHSCI